MNAKLLTALFALTAFTTACEPAKVIQDIKTANGVDDPATDPVFKASTPDSGGGCGPAASCRGPRR